VKNLKINKKKRIKYISREVKNIFEIVKITKILFYICFHFDQSDIIAVKSLSKE